jgi:hypothetical protein
MFQKAHDENTEQTGPDEEMCDDETVLEMKSFPNSVNACNCRCSRTVLGVYQCYSVSSSLQLLQRPCMPTVHNAFFRNPLCKYVI